MNENFYATQVGLDLSKADLYRISRNAVQAAFLNVDRKQALMAELDAYFGDQELGD
jgi:adenosine deaminase